jgi:hypothetical protein
MRLKTVVAFGAVLPAISDAFLRPHFVCVAGELFEQRLEVSEADVRRVERMRNVSGFSHEVSVFRPGWFGGGKYSRTTSPRAPSRVATKPYAVHLKLVDAPLLLHILAIVVLGLMCGSELNVGLFTHPLVGRQPLAVHVPMRAGFAVLLGRVMPFWMSGSTLLNLLLLLPFEHLSKTAWCLATVAFAIQALCVVFSILAAVPINNRIIRWMPENLPADWKVQEARWDSYHAFRTFALIVAFIALIASVASRTP